jgi:H+-translocating NAD(P) transhydrogenase subunit alpha
MVQSMKPGSVIVDMAAEQGGNCELTVPGEVVVKHGVTIIGYTDLPSRLARQSSTLYATNLLRLTEELCKTKDGTINVNMEDEVIRGHDVVKEARSPGRRPRRSCRRRRRSRLRSRGARRRKEVLGHGHGGSGERGLGQDKTRRSCSASARAVLAGRRLTRPAAFLGHFTVFVLACFVGYMVVWNVTPGAAHAADERHQRDQQHHRHRRAGADRAAAGSGVGRPETS